MTNSTPDLPAPTVPFLDHVRGDTFPPNPKGKRPFFRTDQGLVYDWNGTDWAPRDAATAPVVARWLAILDYKDDFEQRAGSYLAFLPYTPGRWLDVARGPAMPTTNLYPGRIFFDTSRKRHYRYDIKKHMPGTPPQWIDMSKNDEIESVRRYAILDKLDDETTQRVVLFMWHPYLILEEEEERGTEASFVADLFKAPPPRAARTAAQKAADAAKEAEEKAKVVP